MSTPRPIHVVRYHCDLESISRIKNDVLGFVIEVKKYSNYIP